MKAALALCLTACTDPTQLVVVVDTDMGPGELDGFRVLVTGPARVVERPAPTDAPFAVFHDGGVELPASFGVVPKGSPDHTVEVEIAAIRDGQGAEPDVELFRTRAITGFIEHRMLRLDLFLARRCLADARRCGEDETCTELGCVSPDRPVESLPRWNGRLPPRHDAGPPPDAGTPPDGGSPADAATPLDASVDAGPGVPATPFFVLVGEPVALSGTVAVNAVAVGDRGDVFVSGTYTSSVEVQGVSADAGAQRTLPFVAAWDAGGEPLWVKTPPQGENFSAGSTAVGFDPVAQALILAVEYTGAQLNLDDTLIGDPYDRNIALAQIDPTDGSLLLHADVLGGTPHLRGLAVSAEGQVALVADLTGTAQALDSEGEAPNPEEWTDSWAILLAAWGPELTNPCTRLIRGTSEWGATGVDWTEQDRLVVGGTFEESLDWPEFRSDAPLNGGGFLLGFGAQCEDDWQYPTIFEMEHFAPHPAALGQPRDRVAAIFDSGAGTALVDGAYLPQGPLASVLVVERTVDGEPVDANAALWEGQAVSAASASPIGEALVATKGLEVAAAHALDGNLTVLWDADPPGMIATLTGASSGLVAAAGTLYGQAEREGVIVGDADDGLARAYLWVFQPSHGE